ncbi:efflux RND transporter periplasmic adaptor subunit [Winogradskyella sp.]|uniref:efflux RND transporter periplasmic adaptor subunit n=1 Tax=Winogradskyella sp. TaxID=1883156 RepID=UPI00261D4840|nr:efflux RND transporter periplasmic adaptor subunit [Winogradskyella sp.]
MKHITTLILTALILVSCGNQNPKSVDDVIASKDLTQIREKKAALDEQYNALGEQIKQLTESIKELDPQEKIPLITTFTVKDTVFNHYVELQGNVTTKENIVIYPEFNGVLQQVLVKEGQKVRKGEALAKIDDGGLSQQVAQLEIQTDLAKTTYDRQKRLWDQKIGSEIQFLQAKTNYEAQQKAVNQIKEQIGKTIVRAPFSGTIDDVLTDQGTVVAPGQSQLFRLVSLKNMYVETDVPERYVANITPGKSVELSFPILGKTMQAKVRQTGDFINPANRTFKVEVTVPEKDKTIKPNLTAKLKINDYTNPKAILIPQSIISENAQGDQYVYTVIEKAENTATAKRTLITTGKTQGDKIEVLSGLENEAELIDKGARSVRDNQTVKILN